MHYLSNTKYEFVCQLGDLVENSDPMKWQETLAILSTYGKSEEFPSLCLALGDRLNDVGDEESASLCYMCALSLEKVSKYWMKQLNQANVVRCFSFILLLLVRITAQSND